MDLEQFIRENGLEDKYKRQKLQDDTTTSNTASNTNVTKKDGV